jgi:Uma2 family endonuclease
LEPSTKTIEIPVRRHRFTVEEYHRMGEAGIFSEDDRVELVEGEIVEMTPIGWRHAETVTGLTRTLLEIGGSHYDVSVQNPLVLHERGEHLPDLALLRRDRPRDRLPAAEDVLVVVEVADSSLRYDREVKLPLYARAGIPEAWLIDLTADRAEVYSEPGERGYGKVYRTGRGGKVVSATVEGLSFGLAGILPEPE